MYEIDNQKFGGFVAALRKEKGYTEGTGRKTVSF